MIDHDEQLVLKAQQGDDKAFGKLVKKYQDKVLYLAYDLVGNFTDAQDIAQNTFYRAFRSIKNFKKQAKFSTWLFRIVVNTAIDVQRAESRKYKIMTKQSLDDPENLISMTIKDAGRLPDQMLVLKDFNEQLENALNELPERQRVAFILRHYHEMSMKEIATVLNCEAATVRSHIFRAIHKLRELLKEYE